MTPEATAPENPYTRDLAIAAARAGCLSAEDAAAITVALVQLVANHASLIDDLQGQGAHERDSACCAAQRALAAAAGRLPF